MNDERRKVVVEILYKVCNNLAEMFNSNIIKNADHHLIMFTGVNNDVVWVDKCKKIFDSKKFKLNY